MSEVSGEAPWCNRKSFGRAIIPKLVVCINSLSSNSCNSTTGRFREMQFQEQKAMVVYSRISRTKSVALLACLFPSSSAPVAGCRLSVVSMLPDKNW